jgi:hypothetical protein
MLVQTQDDQEIIARVAALDIGKAELVCCVRVPEEDRPGRRLQEVKAYATMTQPLLCLADRLACLGGDPGDDGGNQRLPEAGVLPAGGARVPDLASQCPGCEASAWPPESRSSWTRCGWPRSPSGR